MRLAMFKQKGQLFWWLIILLVTISLTIYAFLDYSLIIGWLIGVSFSLFNGYINKLIIKKWLLKNKASGFWRGIIKANIFIIMSLIILLIIIMINKLTHGMSILENNFTAAFSPINIFALIGGFTIGQFNQLKYQSWQTEVNHGTI